MNAPVTNLPAETPRRSVLITLATKYNMEPAAFEQTLRATVVPKDTTREQFAAFLLVANEYGLNPLTKEIYAFPARGGGIVPIVSVDGWLNIINSHPQCNGIEFDDHVESSKVSAITARIWRKDRDKPTVVTEYLAECNRDTDTWKKYPRRMLRHKALIQCARYAFGFAGIVDPDEAERIGAVAPMRDVTPKDDGPPPPPPLRVVEHHETATPPDDGLDIPPGLKRNGDNTLATTEDVFDGAGWLNDLAGAYSGCEDAASFFEVDQKMFAPNITKALPPDRKKAKAIREENYIRVVGDE